MTDQEYKAVTAARCAARTRVMRRVDMTPNARILYYHLDDNAGLEATAIRKQHRIAVELGLDDRQTRSLIAELVEAGDLRVIPGDGRQSSEFVLLWREVYERGRQKIADVRLSPAKNCHPGRQKIAENEAPILIEPVFLFPDIPLPPSEQKPENPACPWCHGRGQRGTGADRSACGMCGGTGERHRRSA